MMIKSIESPSLHYLLQSQPHTADENKFHTYFQDSPLEGWLSFEICTARKFAIDGCTLSNKCASHLAWALCNVRNYVQIHMPVTSEFQIDCKRNHVLWIFFALTIGTYCTHQAHLLLTIGVDKKYASLNAEVCSYRMYTWVSIEGYLYLLTKVFIYRYLVM